MSKRPYLLKVLVVSKYEFNTYHNHTCVHSRHNASTHNHSIIKKSQMDNKVTFIHDFTVCITQVKLL